MSGMVLNPNNLIEALNFVEDVTGRTAVESLNRAGKHIIIGSGSYPGAMQLTPKASRAKILAVSDRQIRGFIIKKAKASGKWPISGTEIGRRVRLERMRRLRAAGYAAYAGWSPAAKAMGGTGVRGVTEDFPRSEAAHGSGRKATAFDLTAELVNTAPAAERIGFDALQQAVDNAAQDLVDYGTRKMQEAMDKVKA